MSALGPHGGRGERGMDRPQYYVSSHRPQYYDVWDPFGSFGGNNLDRNDPASALANAHVDWRETDSAHIFTADLPGVRKEEIKVQLEEDNNTLQISGERTKEVEDGGDKWHRRERRRGSFMRRFRLPENANVEGISCALEHGVLTVTVPKKETHETPRNVKYIDIA